MFDNLFEKEKKTTIKKPKTGQMFESLFEAPIESRKMRVEKLRIEAEESRKIAEEMAKPTAIAKETITGTWDILKGIGGAIKNIAKQTPHYISEAAKHPHQTAIGVMETGVFKPTIAVSKLLLPKKYEAKIIPKMEAGLEEVQEMMPSQEARTVGNITGWLMPYTAGAKIVKGGMEATNIAVKLGKHAPGVANAFGFLGTGQLLFDSKTESSRARRAIEDLAILAGFRIGGYVLKGASQMAGKAVERTVMPIFARMKSGKKVPLVEVEKAVYKARAITEGMTKKKPEQIIEKEIIPQAKKIKVSPQKELAVLKEINKEIPGIKGIESRIKEIEVQGIKPTIALKPLAKEARKYKSAEEFMKAQPLGGKRGREIGIGAGFFDNIKASPISKSSEKIVVYRGVPKGQIKKIVDGDYVSLSKKNALTFGSEIQTFSIPKNQLRKAVSIDALVFNSGKTKSQLTDIYTQATKGVKEATPIAQKGVFKPITAEKGLPVSQVGKPSKVALSIEAKAIEKDLTKGFKDLAEYTPTTIKQQAERMSTLMKDIEKTKRVAMGREPLPEGLNGATVITTMEKYALKTKDGKLMAELARSPLVSETSMAGQTLRLTAEREPESAVRKMKEIIKAREEAVKRKLKWKKPEQIKSGIKKSLEDKIKKTKPNKYSWINLVNEIAC